MAKETIIIMGIIAAGVAIAGSLFLVFPDMMFKNTGFETQGGESTDVPVFVDETNTAGVVNSTNSTSNATSGSSSTTEPPY
jgi:hypothetical protein